MAALAPKQRADPQGLVIEQTGLEVEPPLSAEEAEADKLENLMERMSALKRKGDGMDPAERRELAAKAALEMASMFVDDEDEDAKGERSSGESGGSTAGEMEHRRSK
jgi:hypothetical protein